MKGFLKDLGFNQESSVVYYDNQSVMYLSKHQAYHKWLKHISIKLHFVREVTDSGTIFVKKIKTRDNLADTFTKVLSGYKFDHRL